VPADYFLQIAGIEGESQDTKHKGWIDVASWSWGEARPDPGPGTGAGSGKVQMGDFTLMTRMSKASPKLFLACANGKHIKEAVLVGRKASAKAQQEFLTWTFSDILVTSYQTSASAGGDDVPFDSISLNFSKIKVEYKSQKADGSLDAPIVAGWDVKTNTKV
jgi:type VI secretion system secreted protein Hcp